VLWWIPICSDLPLHANSPEPLTVGVLTLEPLEVSRVNLTSTSFQMMKFPTDVINKYSIFVLRTDNGRYSVFKEIFPLFWICGPKWHFSSVDPAIRWPQRYGVTDGVSPATNCREIIQNLSNKMINWRLFHSEFSTALCLSIMAY